MPVHATSTGLTVSSPLSVVTPPKFYLTKVTFNFHAFQTHGSKNGGVVDAIQIETPEPLLMNPNVTIVIEYACTLTRSIVRFHRLYYNEQGPERPAIRAPDFCSRPLYHLGPFFACLFCPGSYPLQMIHCNKLQWRQTYYFNIQ